VLAPPYRLDGARAPVGRLPPDLGQDTREVLTAELGLDAERLALLQGAGVIA
jgi:crotonobetainyl-CoA:carnitine CoA-transferase CaiB-like acyl-CoA transferase